MESIDLELGELFDRDAVDEDGGDDVGAIQDAATGDADATNGQEGDEVLSNLQKLAKGAAKKRVLKPQPKLDAQRLMSDRGLAILPNLFKDVEFAGKGHEAEDLSVLMLKLEHWAHRLFPKLSFDDFIERLEKLGAKKQIQTCVKRIRLDMPILDADFATADGPDADRRDAGNENAVDANAEEAYDAMIQEAMYNQMRQQESDDCNSDHEDRGNVSLHTSSQADRGNLLSASSQPSSSTNTPPLSSEQQRRIEQNRLLAMQKRAARLGLVASQGSPSSQPCSSPADAASGRPALSDPVSDSASGTCSQLSSVAPTSSDDVMQTADEIINDLENDNV